MDIQNTLKELLNKEKNNVRKEILEMLLNHIDCISFTGENSKNESLLCSKGDELSFIYFDPSVDNYPYTFTEEKEIYELLKNILNENRSIVFSHEEDVRFSLDEIWENIHQSLLLNDKDSFLTFSSYLKKYE